MVYVTVLTVSIKVKLIAYASDNAPGLIVLVIEPVTPWHSTRGVPAIVNPVTVAVVQIVVVADEIRTNLPVPKLIVLVFALLLANMPVVNA